MKIQNQATTVLERTSAYLKSGLLRNKPAWYEVVANHPPSTDLTRIPKALLNGTYKDPITKISGAKTRLSDRQLQNKNRSIHRVPKLKFVEDELRNLFYKRHPWEFSRPKVLVENNGNDNAHNDWSHMVQLNKPLDGESVVQRTVWLLKNTDKTIFEAYDHARFEFYKLRMDEEMQSVVSREESSMFGAIYTSTHLQHNIEQEQIFVDEWATLAAEKTTIKRASSSSKVTNDDGEENASSMFETVDEGLEIEEVEQKQK